MPTITIGKLAKSCNVRVDTIRYYEKVGLLMPLDRDTSGYRVYDEVSEKRLKFVRTAQQLGFTLEEIKELLTISEMAGKDCGDIRNKTQVKIDEVTQKITNLKKIKKALEKLENLCPGKGKAISECNIIQYFYEGKP